MKSKKEIRHRMAYERTKAITNTSSFAYGENVGWVNALKWVLGE